MVEKVDILDISLLLLSSLLSIFLGIGSNMIFSISGTDIIFVSIVGTIFSYPLLLVAKYIISNNKYDNIFELNKNISPKLGKILNLMLFLGLFLIGLFILFNISDFLNIEYLPESKVNFTEILVLLPIIYILTKDLNSILKINQIFCIISIFLIAIDFIGIFHSFELTNIEPIFTTSKINFIKSIIYYICFNGISIAMLALIGKGKILNDDIKSKYNKIGKSITKVYIFANIIQFIIIISCIMTLGMEYINIFRFPEYVALKQFSLFNMLERVENILSLQFYFNSISILSYIIYNIVALLPKSNKIKIYPILVSTIMYIITNIVFVNNSYFIVYMKKYFAIIGYLFIILPVIIIYFILHKKINENV